MSWQHWTLVVWAVIEAVGSVLRIGRPAPERTPGYAAWAVVVWATFVVLLVTG